LRSTGMLTRGSHIAEHGRSAWGGIYFFPPPLVRVKKIIGDGGREELKASGGGRKKTAFRRICLLTCLKIARGKYSGRSMYNRVYAATEWKGVYLAILTSLRKNALF